MAGENETVTAPTKLEISGVRGENPTSNLKSLFKQNCELTNQTNMLLYDGKGADPVIEDCSKAEPPASATEESLTQENNALNNLVKGLGSLDNRRVF